MAKYQHYMEMDTTFIYALNDPETGECRYVGKADDPHDRLFGKNGHLKKCHTLKHHCANWIRSLVARGLVPHLEILQEVPVANWPLWERVWIKASRKIGMDLTNVTEGGEGLGSGKEHPCFGKRPHNFGKKASPEVCARLSGARKGKAPPNKGKKASPELCAKLSAAHLGKKLSPEHCAKLSASRLGRRLSPEHRAKLSVARKGKIFSPLSPEHRASLSEAQKKRREREKISRQLNFPNE